MDWQHFQEDKSRQGKARQNKTVTHTHTHTPTHAHTHAHTYIHTSFQIQEVGNQNNNNMIKKAQNQFPTTAFSTSISTTTRWSPNYKKGQSVQK